MLIFSLDHCIPIGGVCIIICMLTPSSAMGQSNQKSNRVCSKTDRLNKLLNRFEDVMITEEHIGLRPVLNIQSF